MSHYPQRKLSVSIVASEPISPRILLTSSRVSIGVSGRNETVRANIWQATMSYQSGQFRRLVLTLLLAVVVCHRSATAADINGVVQSSTVKYATVTSTSNLVPTPGDKAKIYFKLPGVDSEISVATGHVYEITGPNIMVQIDQATGTVAKNQLVRITSTNPKKKGEVQAAAGSPSASPAKPAPGLGSATPAARTTPSPLGSVSSAVTRSTTPQPGTSPSATAGSKTADPVNPAKQIVGTWQGPRHRKEFRADGTFITDPHLVPDAPVCRWSLSGDRLTEHYPIGDATYRIVSINNEELVTTDDKGHTYRAKRIPDDQAAREKADW